MKHRVRILASMSLWTGAVVTIALAAVSEEQKCLASKLKTVGKLEACLFKSYALHVLKGTPAVDMSVCSAKFSESWAKVESKYGSACPTSGDVAAIEDLATGHAAAVFDLLDGDAPACGDGVIDAGESCDGTDLSGSDCVSLGFTGGTLACSAGCTFDTTGCTSAPSTCEPQDCIAAGATCGPAGDGCGDAIQCGTCSAPQSCGGGGLPSQCGGNCTPTSCVNLGAVCGVHPDGCGGTTASCGTCPDGQVCMGMPSNCATAASCTPLSQAVACGSRTCGLASDGCGDVLSCGTCPSGQGCLSSTGTCVASGACIPRSCDGLASGEGTIACNSTTEPTAGCYCGAAADGCGGLLDCGACGGGEQCGEGGPNVCN